MLERKVIVKNNNGLHARAAAKFVKETNKFASDVYLIKDGIKVDAKSIIGVMALGVSKGKEVTLITSGIDEKEAMESLVNLIEKGLDV